MSTRPSARRARTPASASASLAIVSSDPGRPVDSAVAWKTRMRRSARSEPSSSARLPHHLDAADGAHRTNRHRRPCSRTPDHQNDVDDPSRHRRNVAAVHFSNIRRFFGGQFSMSPGGQFRMSLDKRWGVPPPDPLPGLKAALRGLTHEGLIIIYDQSQTDDEGVVSQPGYTLSKPSNGPNDRDHLKCRVSNQDSRLQKTPARPSYPHVARMDRPEPNPESRSALGRLIAHSVPCSVTRFPQQTGR